MKYRIIFSLGVFIAFALNTHAQIKDRTPFTPPTVQPQFTPNVQKVDLGVDSLQSNGTIYFSAAITSTGRGMVHYQWILSPQQTTPNAPGPLVRKDSVMLNGLGKDKVFIMVHKLANSTTIKMQTLTPNIIMSNIEHY